MKKVTKKARNSGDTKVEKVSGVSEVAEVTEVTKVAKDAKVGGDLSTELKFLSVSEFAQLFNLAKSTVYNLIRERKVPYVKIGRSIRIPLKGVLKNNFDFILNSNNSDSSNNSKVRG